MSFFLHTSERGADEFSGRGSFLSVYSFTEWSSWVPILDNLNLRTPVIFLTETVSLTTEKVLKEMSWKGIEYVGQISLKVWFQPDGIILKAVQGIRDLEIKAVCTLIHLLNALMAKRVMEFWGGGSQWCYNLIILFYSH